MRNPSYALEGTIAPPETDLPDLMSAVQALEEWRAEEDLHQSGQAFVRWRPEKTQHLAVYVAPAPNPHWHGVLTQALRDWEASSAGYIRFFTTVRPEDADITVEWTDAAVTGREFEVGHTDRTIAPPNWIGKATITLLAQPQIDKHLTKTGIENRLYTTMLHELGHALGLEHSQNPRDVMHHQGWKNQQLTPGDLHQLQEIYTRPVPTLFWL